MLVRRGDPREGLAGAPRLVFRWLSKRHTFYDEDKDGKRRNALVLTPELEAHEKERKRALAAKKRKERCY